MSDIEDEPPPILLPCTICSRTFRPEVLERHAKVCEKTANKKRRVFDSFKNRVSGTELEEFLGPAPLPGQIVKRPIKSPIKKKGPPKWKETHENLIAVLRAARGVTQSSDTAIESAKHGGNEQCPSCNRFFGPRAFDRHVEFCKEKTARIKMTPSKVSQAQERLEARTKYRAPLSIKPKLTTKEKYSPMLVRKESTESCSLSTSSTKTSPPVPALNKNSKVVKQNSSNFTRQSPIRSSERQRSISPTKKATISSSKTQTKLSHQPKVKENLKDPDDLRPRTGSKSLTQEKLRSSYVKLSQLEDEIPSQLSKLKQMPRKSIPPKSRVPSDDETSLNIETENTNNNKQSKINGKIKTRWSSSESINKPVSLLIEKGKLHEEKFSDDEKLVLRSRKIKEIKKEEEKTKDDLKSPKKNKKSQKAQILNDLSVNDESFGIFVAPCKPSSPSFRNFQNSAKESFLKSKSINKKEKAEFVEEDKIEVSIEKKIKKSGKKEKTELPHLESSLAENPQSFLTTIEQSKIQKIEKYSNSKIPKPKSDSIAKYTSKAGNFDLTEVPFDQASNSNLTEVDISSEQLNPLSIDKNAVEAEFLNTNSEIKKKVKKWQSISEMSTDDLLHMSEDFEVCKDYDCEEMTESKIWEIAAEQFLKGEETVENTSPTSIESVNECMVKKQIIPVAPNKNLGDDFIVLHVTDPAKMDENDADMKVSVSEPCFPYSGKIQKSKEKTRLSKKPLDILLFTASPFQIQKTCPKKKKLVKVKKQKPVLRLSAIREKTFLTNDLPKAKRRKIEVHDVEKLFPFQNIDFTFEAIPKNVLKEKKKFFLEKLKEKYREKVQKWSISSNFHMKFMEDFNKSLDDDIKELKNLFKGKKRRRRFNKEEFKKEKTKEIKRDKSKNNTEKNSCETKVKKKYEYFEIDLSDDNIEKKKNEISPKKSNQPEFENEIEIFANNSQSSPKKKFESFEIINDDKIRKSNQKKKYKNSKMNESVMESHNELDNNILQNEDQVLNKTYSIAKENKTAKMTSTPKKNIEDWPEKLEAMFSIMKNDSDYCESLSVELQNGSNQSSNFKVQNFTSNDSMQTSNYFNSSLENIEEVDEAEEKNIEESHITPKRNIEIEDFILTKPNTTKLLSKEKSCLDQLFPKPQKISEAMTAPDSITAIHLDFTADSIFDLKLNEKKNLKELPEVRSTRILQKRNEKESHLPQIKIKNDEKKEKSMISLIDLWKNKRNVPEKEKLLKLKATLPNGKLTPLFKKNSFQIILRLLLKNNIWETVNNRIAKKSQTEDSYDPFKQAERQMLALLSWPSTADIKTVKDFSPQSKSKTNKNQNLESSPTSAFSKYPSKDDKSGRTTKSLNSAKKNLNGEFKRENLTNKNNKDLKPTYTSADDWEQIFEKHFDVNRNEMTEEITKSVKSALDGLLKYTNKNSPNTSDKKESTTPPDLIENSVITEVLYTSTPKQNSKSDKTLQSRFKEKSIDLDQTLTSHQKNSNFPYGRITPPEDFNDALGKNRRDEKNKRNSGISLSSLSFCSRISDTTLADEEVLMSNLEIIEKAAAAVVAPRTPRRKYARSQSVFDERNKMLFAKTYDHTFSSSDDGDVELLPKIVDKRSNKSPSRNPHPKPVPFHYCRSQSVTGNKCKGDGDHTDEGDHISSPENNRRKKSKFSGDSAYSSLNRKSPRQNVQPKQEGDVLSSSGSEHSLIENKQYSQNSKDLNVDQSKKDQPVKMSKFCHECGSKYPVAVAKFCCECGVRRLII